MKYKIGDRVKVRKDLAEGEVYDFLSVTREMAELAGKTVNITDIHIEANQYNIAETTWLWNDKMFEDITKERKGPLDEQIGGEHYTKYAIQPIEFTMKNKLNFIQGNVIKYIMRYENKNGLEDLKKAIHYIKLEAKLKYGEEI